MGTGALTQVDDLVPLTQAEEPGVVPKRREATYAGLLLFLKGVAGLITILILIPVMGGLGTSGMCDTRLAAKENPMECAWGVWGLLAVVRPLMSAGVLFGAYMFPVRGQRLKDLIAKQADLHKAQPGTKACSEVARRR